MQVHTRTPSHAHSPRHTCTVSAHAHNARAGRRTRAHRSRCARRGVRRSAWAAAATECGPAPEYSRTLPRPLHRAATHTRTRKPTPAHTRTHAYTRVRTHARTHARTRTHAHRTRAASAVAHPATSTRGGGRPRPSPPQTAGVGMGHCATAGHGCNRLAAPLRHEPVPLPAPAVRRRTGCAGGYASTRAGWEPARRIGWHGRALAGLPMGGAPS